MEPLDKINFCRGKCLWNVSRETRPELVPREPQRSRHRPSRDGQIGARRFPEDRRAHPQLEFLPTGWKLPQLRLHHHKTEGSGLQHRLVKYFYFAFFF